MQLRSCRRAEGFRQHGAKFGIVVQSNGLNVLNPRSVMLMLQRRLKNDFTNSLSWGVVERCFRPLKRLT